MRGELFGLEFMLWLLIEVKLRVPVTNKVFDLTIRFDLIALEKYPYEIKVKNKAVV